VTLVGVFRLGADGWAPQETTETRQIVSGFLNFLHKNLNYLGKESTNCGSPGTRGDVPLFRYLSFKFFLTGGI
jgi:hypothetical protein